MSQILDKILLLYLFFYLSLFITDYSFICSTQPIANIGGPTAFFLFLISFRWFIGKKSFMHSPIIKKLNSLGKISDKKLLFFAVIVVFLIFSSLSIARHLSLSSGASDLGIFDQAVWNTLDGNLLFSSLKNNMNLLGDHFEPILLVFVPLYKIWPSILVLLIAQSLLLASAIIPLYLIAKDRLKKRLLIYSFIIAYILSRPLRGVAFSDFHPECFILPVLFWTYYFLLKRKNLLFFLSLFMLLLCKEDTAFLVAGLGLFTAFFQKRIRLGLGLFFLGTTIWVFLTKYIIPSFNPSGIYPYMNRLPFGLTYADNFKAVLADPVLLGKLFIDRDKIEYVLKIFGPLGFLSLLSPAHYILIAIPLLRNLLPSDPNFSGWYNISSHYTAALIPFVFIGAIYGAGMLIAKIKHKNTSKIATLFIIVPSLFFYGKTDAHKFARFVTTIRNNRTLERFSYLKMVPADASVAANFNLVPHLSHRKYIFECNPQSKTSYITEYIVIDMNLLGYLSKDDMAKIKPYFKEISNKGYKKVFSNPDETFLILHNPNIDKSLVEKINLISEKSK